MPLERSQLGPTLGKDLFAQVSCFSGVSTFAINPPFKVS